jgi:tetratricopeptide (TPR) repeat protein
MATIPPEPVYRSAAPPTDRGEGPATIEPAQAGRVDLVLRQPATPSRVEPEPAPAGGSLLAPLALVALAVAGIWALATGRLETIAGMVVGIEATPTVVLSVGPEPTVASIVVEVTPSSVVAAGQQDVPPVAESTVATVAPPVAAQPPAVAAGQAPASGPAETPEPTAVPVAQVAAAPPSPEQQVQAAQAQIERGEHAAALAALVALKASAPETAGLDDALYGAYLGHGQQQLERGLLDESQAAYAKALELRVDDPAALDGQKQVSLARLWRTMEEAWDRDDAVATAALEEILALDPGYRDASQKLYAILVAQANRQLEAGEVDGALVPLRRAREVYPEGEEARVLVEAHTPPPTPESEPEPAHNQAPGPASQPAPQPAPAQKPAPQQPPAPSLPKPALPSLPNPGGLPIPRP